MRFNIGLKCESTMGNEGSQLSGLEIEENAVEVTDFWAHYQATIKDSCRYFSLKSDGSVSVFKGEAVMGPLWAVSTPLEKFSNNLLKFRHPCIIRYLSAWQQRSTLHLATEFVQPLSHVLKSQNPLQICIGLNNILRALVFLHEQAGMSHNNISISAVYVTGDGQWKLGGLQYLCPFSDLTSAYLKQARIHRYDKAVDPNEENFEINTKIDQYSFAVLVEDVFKGCTNENVPYIKEFRKYCQEYLQHDDPSQRPNLSEVLLHNFFNHEFIDIYKFLNFLPLKTEEEKAQFFSNILESLKCFDEETVAKQLGGMLLSRLTLLDQTARKHVVPHVFKPRNDRAQNGSNAGFFTLPIYKEHVKPRLMQLFGVRDSQIRLLLLNHFSKFVHVFTHEELSQHILPELLLGIKDTDDNLVAATLICLSELVPILGADTVVGGKRSKLFTDGRPNSHSSSKTGHIPITNMHIPVKSLKDLACSEEVFQDNSTIVLNERPSPVGGEDVDDELKNSEIKVTDTVGSEDDWSDWDNNVNRKNHIRDRDLELNVAINTFSDNKIPENSCNPANDLKSDQNSAKATKLQQAAFEAKKNIIDICDLDIKNNKNDSTKKGEEIDFFADMMPVIEKQAVIDVEEATVDLSSKLAFIPDDDGDNEGWSDNWN